MSDLFHENLATPFIDKVFAVMALARQHDFQILTKRPKRMRNYCSLLNTEVCSRLAAAAFEVAGERGAEGITNLFELAAPDDAYPFPNIWLGVSVEDQRRADERIPLLLETPAAVRFISAEPLLGRVSLVNYVRDFPPHRLQWVILGGESGPHYREMDPFWATDIASVCAQYGVPLYVKQDSGPRPGKQGRLSDALWARKEYPVVRASPTERTA